MTELRQRMLNAMLVRGLSARTQECYVEAVARLARHYHRSPELLSAPEIQAYMLHLVKDRKLSYSSPPPHLTTPPAPAAFCWRKSLAAPQTSARVEVMLCPCCKLGTLKVVATLAGCRQLPAASSMSAQPRGPP